MLARRRKMGAAAGSPGGPKDRVLEAPARGTGLMAEAAAAVASQAKGAPHDHGAVSPPLYRRSRPFFAFAIMVLPFFALVGVVVIPFIGFVLLVVLLPVEFGRIGGRRLSRGDALWVAVPAGFAVASWELLLVYLALSVSPVLSFGIDLLGALFIAAAYGCNAFFFSIGALSTSFEASEPVPREAR